MQYQLIGGGGVCRVDDKSENDADNNDDDTNDDGGDGKFFGLGTKLQCRLEVVCLVCALSLKITCPLIKTD